MFEMFVTVDKHQRFKFLSVKEHLLYQAWTFVQQCW